jgi:hypothetical protein
MQPGIFRFAVGGTFTSMWLMSMVLPVAEAGKGAALDWWPGYMVLIFGWFGFFFGQFGWLANLLLPIAVAIGVAARTPMRKTFAVLGALLLTAAANSLLWTYIPMDDGYHPIRSYGIGYYLWIIAVAGAGLALILRNIIEAAAAGGE